MLFTHLIEVNEQEVATRRRAPQSLLQGDAKTAADALTEARLLVTGKGEDEQPTLEVPGRRGSHLHPTPTDRSVQISRTTLFRY